MVTSWILNSLSKKIADSVEYASDAIELFKELEDCYVQNNGARLYQIKKEINGLSQGALDITGDYTKLKKLWEELNTLNKRTQCSCLCNCGAKQSMYKAKQDRRLIQFLIGLNEVYTIVRGSILMMNPLPTLAQDFSLLIQDEKQREIKPNNQLSIESTSLNNSNQTARYPQNVHQNLRHNRGKRMVANVQGMSTYAMTSKLDECDAQDENQNVNLTKEKYGQLVILLQHFQLGNDGENSRNSSPTNVVNFAVLLFAHLLLILVNSYVDALNQRLTHGH
ncbi:PREDICTED: uncharacterized protein LOC109208987 [Nicotiana attenuata]|uniref:uncharacterized protein LOC109208987 n=1 Tax=Nicotiana attenuata TaxID=49451 RepID=UPI00090501DC|nr:PREDICTED: uncharacterized protein LOC109208987 [Nicotiana attenuata]